MSNIENIISLLSKVREKSPLVHNITNFVVMNNTANALLSIGASPVMAHAQEEVEDMVCIASSLVLNMGTLNSEWVASMIKAGIKAKTKNIPVIFDPVGVGATPYRKIMADKIIEACHPDIIRGNASEIMSLCGQSITTKGVDSTEKTSSALQAAKILATKENCIVVVSGQVDYITNGIKSVALSNGTEMMSKVTGMGCTSTAMCGAFAGVVDNIDHSASDDYSLFAAAIAAMSIMGVAGDIATSQSDGPGSLQVKFLDILYSINESEIMKRIKYEEI
ncbi:MAG: hydroxyethylthiazole kinase [Bacteroidales bacterium]